MIKSIGALLIAAVFLAFMSAAAMAQATKPEPPAKTEHQHPQAEPGKPVQPKAEQPKPDHPRGEQHKHEQHEHPKGEQQKHEHPK